MQLILASTSQARQAVLRAAGIIPAQLWPPATDEAAVVEAANRASIAAGGSALTAAETVQLLAKAKAEDVAERHRDMLRQQRFTGVILGGDSMFLLDGELLGKPLVPEVALERAKQHRGKTGVLYSGHWVVVVENGEIITGGGLVDSATVRLSDDVTDEELAAYVASGEPLQLAGGFAIDGLAGAFIDRIEGSHSCVMGLSLPALRRLLIGLGLSYTALWQQNSN